MAPKLQSQYAPPATALPRPRDEAVGSRLMLRSSILCIVLSAACLPACGDDPQVGVSASAEPKPTAKPLAAAPSPTTTASSAPKKPPRECKGTVATFEDPVLEKMIRVQLSKPEGPIQNSELAKVKTLNLTDSKNMDTLDPCIFPHLKGLKGLYLAPGELDNISLLQGLGNLESLRISITKVKDISPLKSLSKLDRLDIGRTPVRDLTPLAELKNLTEIVMDETEVSDLTPLAGLTKLTLLSIKKTGVKNLGPLSEMKELKNLYIEGSSVSDTSPVRSLPKLKIHGG